MAEISTENTETQSEKNSCGVLGLIFSIIGICLCGLWLFSIPGLILSLIGLRKEPRKAATAGVIIGGVGTVAFLFIGSLMIGITLPAVANARQIAKKIKTQYSIHSVQLGSTKYRADHNAYPTSMQELQDGTYITSSDTQDAWDHQLRFTGGGNTRPVITSAGRDGEFDTDDDVAEKDEVKSTQ